MAITKDKQVVLKGTRDIMTGLWRVPLQSLDRPANQSNNLNQVNGKEGAIKYLHASEFIPVQGTWARAVNRGYFNTWPGITSKYINRMPKAESTTKGHLAHQKNTCSTTTNKSSGE